MTSHESDQASYASEQHARTVKTNFNAPDQQPNSADREEAARSVMHPEYHDPDWRYYHGAMAMAG